MKFDQIEFDQIKFTGNLTELSSLNFQSAKIKQLIFEDFKNKGSLLISSPEYVEGQTLEIIKSDMGKADLINCDYKKSDFIFINSKVSELFLAQTDFPKKINSKRSDKYSQAQLAFGQLSTAFQKQGDSVRSFEYQSREVESHYNDISLFYWPWPLINLSKISLGLNKLSNNFGRHWGRSLVFTTLSCIFIYYLLIVSTNQYRISWAFDWNPKFIPSFLKFINPIRFIDTDQVYDKLGVTLTNTSYFLDLLGRIVAAYGFYQLIAAFRKYGKKS